MQEILGSTADDAYRGLVHNLQHHWNYQQGRDQTTKEVTNITATILDPRSRLVFARNINPAFAIAETIWILAGGNNTRFIEFWNPRMKNYAEDDGVFHGAYGERLGSNPQLTPFGAEGLYVPEYRDAPSQLEIAYNHLCMNPSSRQVVLQIWDKERDLVGAVNSRGEPKYRDIPCNLMSHLLIRGGELHWMQVMRSNDLIWGTPYNFFQWTAIQEIFAGWLGLQPGRYNHVIGSLHVYERHWDELNSIVTVIPDSEIAYNDEDLRIFSYSMWCKVMALVVDYAVLLTQHRSIADIHETVEKAAGSGIPSAYVTWIVVLAAEALRLLGFEQAALDMIDETPLYWQDSWLSWLGSKIGV